MSLAYDFQLALKNDYLASKIIFYKTMEKLFFLLNFTLLSQLERHNANRLDISIFMLFCKIQL